MITTTYDAQAQPRISPGVSIAADPDHEVASMSNTTLPGPEVAMTCQPTRKGDMIVFAYTIENRGQQDVYVFDAVAERSPTDRNAAIANPDHVTIWRDARQYAHVLKGVAALPIGRSVSVRIIPLAAALHAGESLERVLTLAMPLAEHSPYFPVGRVQDYRLEEIKGVSLTVEYLPASAPGFTATPVDFAPGLYRVAASQTIPALRRVDCAFVTRGLHLLVRTDAYPRPD
jgi:hypothetical protein